MNLDIQVEMIQAGRGYDLESREVYGFPKQAES